MSRKFREEVAEAVDAIVIDHIGSLINNQIADMIDFGDMADIEQLAVIDGAIALGAWVSTPDELSLLRRWRAELVENME